MTESDDQLLDERLKSALWFTIGKTVDDETIRLGVNATPQFIGALTELVWNQFENTSIDIESFAKHAGRQTVTTDDIMLLARRNQSLEELMQNWLTRERIARNDTKGKQKSRLKDASKTSTVQKKKKKKK